MTASRRRTMTQIKETEKSPRFHPGRCEDCGDWSRLRGWRLGDWICGFCFHGEERDKPTINTNGKTKSEKSILYLLAKKGELTFEELKDESGYAKSTLRKSTKNLLESNEITRQKTSSDTRGRKPFVYRLP